MRVRLPMPMPMPMRLRLRVLVLVLGGCDDSGAQSGSDGPVIVAHDAAVDVPEEVGPLDSAVETDVAAAQDVQALMDTWMAPDLAAIAPGLIGYWKFDEGSGTAVLDSSGLGNHGKLVQGGTLASSVDSTNPIWGEGKVGNSLILDGVDDWISIPHSESINSTASLNSVSIAAWLKVHAMSSVNEGMILQRHKSGRRLEHFALGLFDGWPMSRVNDFEAVGPQNFPRGDWTHIAMTYDGITQRLYMHGAEVASMKVSSRIAVDQTPVTIGAGINDKDITEHLGGLYDEVRLYNRALTPAEVKALAEM